MRRQHLEFNIGQRSAFVQRIGGSDQDPLGRRPARSVGLAKRGGTNLFVGEMGGLRER
jgi:hypothetical protein